VAANFGAHGQAAGERVAGVADRVVLSCDPIPLAGIQPGG